MPYEREICAPEEDIARAICSAHYDETKDRIYSGLFKGPDTSVGRLSISPLQELIGIFRREVAEPKNPLRMVGQINVGLLQKLGREHKDNRMQPIPVEIVVVAKPEPEYLAHAEIPQKIPRGLARKIVSKLQKQPV